MITKEELLVALEDSSRNLYKSNEVFGLALKGLESESTVKRLIQSRNFWRKKYDELADELDDKIIALEDKLKNTISLKYHVQLLTSANQRIDPLKNERDALEDKLKAKDADLAEASKTINDAQAKHRYLEDRLLDMVGSDHQQIISLRNERNAFQRLVGELEIEKSCIRADLENVCKELGVLKGEIEKWEDAHRAKNADIDKLLTENKELARRERELGIVLGEWAAVEVYLRKSPKLTIGDKLSVACLCLLQERDELEADLRFLLGQ